ncbi:hypothetical protein [Mycobacterium triplex]|nr:hypothetical protein [Mycobacterium triplex]
MIGAFMLVFGLGNIGCFSECAGNASGIKCSSCDSPSDGQTKLGYHYSAR